MGATRHDAAHYAKFPQASCYFALFGPAISSQTLSINVLASGQHCVYQSHFRQWRMFNITGSNTQATVTHHTVEFTLNLLFAHGI
jgi:hypothetical protein